MDKKLKLLYPAGTRLYVVYANISKWNFLSGYSCNSQDQDNFIGHLGWKFKNCCSQYDINKAIESGQIKIESHVLDTDMYSNRRSINIPMQVSKRYLYPYGYMVEFSNGKKMSFTSEEEANEWLESQK